MGSEGWCVLRTASRYTIGLAESLTLDGYEVWTPIEVRTIRVPRKNVKREIRLPIMPSYVFARASRLLDVLLLADAESKRFAGGCHAGFSVMRSHDRIPIVPDCHLAELRRIEVKRTPKKKAKTTFIPGVIVKVGGGSFGGMIGRVERSNTGHTLVLFNDRYAVKIPTLLLKEDGVSDEAEIAAIQMAA